MGRCRSDCVGQRSAVSSARRSPTRNAAEVPTVKLLVTGTTGQVGWQLLRTLAPLGEVVAPSRAEVDLANPDQAADFVREIRPDVLVNPAAYTAVDKAEAENELATTVNAVTPGRMAQELAKSGGLMIHYSTDYVFDGTKAEAVHRGRHDESAQRIWPQQTRGGAGHCGERMCPCHPAHLVGLRQRGNNFLRRVLRLAREKHELRMVADQYGAPTWARAIAEATAVIVARAGSAGTRRWRASGVYNLTAAGSTTWAGFAETILELRRNAGVAGGLRGIQWAVAGEAGGSHSQFRLQGGGAASSQLPAQQRKARARFWCEPAGLEAPAASCHAGDGSLIMNRVRLPVLCRQCGLIAASLVC